VGEVRVGAVRRRSSISVLKTTASSSLVSIESGGSDMSEHVYRITEIVGSSTDSVDDAIRNGARRAAKTLHHLDWFEVTEIRGHFADETIGHYQVTMKVGFRLDDDE